MFCFLEKQGDDDFVLQIAYVFYSLLNYRDESLAATICADGSPMVEYLINLANDKNARLRRFCEKALHVVVVVIFQGFEWGFQFFTMY